MGAYYIKYVFLNLINMISGVVLFPIYFYSCKKKRLQISFQEVCRRWIFKAIFNIAYSLLFTKCF